MSKKELLSTIDYIGISYVVPFMVLLVVIGIILILSIVLGILSIFFPHIVSATLSFFCLLLGISSGLAMWEWLKYLDRRNKND